MTDLETDYDADLGPDLDPELEVTINVAEPVPPSGKVRADRRWWTTLDIACLALLVRLGLVGYVLAEPVWDAHYYDFGARRIAAGLGYSEDIVVAAVGGGQHTIWEPWAHYPVGYPGFLSLFYRLFGGGVAVAPVANALTGALLAAMSYRVALHVFGSRSSFAEDRGELRSMIAGLLVALHPGLVLYSGALMTEPLAALGMLASLWCAATMRRPWRGAVVASVLLGLTTLVRPNAILLAPLLAWVSARGARTSSSSGAPASTRSGPASSRRGSVPPPSSRRGSVPPPSSREGAPPPSRMVVNAQSLKLVFARFALIVVCTLATVAPWTIRNCRTMDACAFVSTNAGWNLVIGSAPGATGKFEFLVGHTPQGAPECAEGGQVAQDRCWFRYGTQTIRRDVWRWLKLIPAKLHHTVDSEWFPINYLREARPDLVSARAHVVWGRVLTIFNHAMVALAALAAVGRPVRRRNRLSTFGVQVVTFGAMLALLVAGIDASSPTVWPLAIIACVLPFLPLPGAPRRDPMEHGVAGIILTTLITHAIFFGEDRYHLVASPAFAILAAGIGRRMEMVLPSRA